uniref:Uncharacterized protein n=1 Tax=Oryza punctata TaxID=4537 RepID=A0A0E0LHZ8_ORYPU
MSTESQDHSSHYDESINSEKLEKIIWEETTDPTEVQLEAQLEATLLSSLDGTSNQRLFVIEQHIDVLRRFDRACMAEIWWSVVTRLECFSFISACTLLV